MSEKIGAAPIGRPDDSAARRTHWRGAATPAEEGELRQELQLAMQEASAIAESLFRQHFSADEDYTSGRSVWGLCDSLRGVLSQIDNMTTGLVRAPQPQVEEQEALEDMLAGVSAPAAQAINLLASDHSGMKVDYRGLFSQVQRVIKRSDPGYAEMLRQLEGHLQELGQRWYAGDTNVVDEILQLYCIERDARKTVGAAATAAPQAQAVERDALTPAARDVLAERARQVSAEGWTPERDDQYTDCQLAAAAASYAVCGKDPKALKLMGVTAWPWRDYWWKPETYRRNLEKAGALILAEIERIDRAAVAAAKGSSK